MRTVISFLGRVSRDEKSRYRRTPYRFPDGKVTDPAAFFGYVLSARVKAERLVILGTPGSMWDHLFEGDLDLGTDAETDREALLGSVESQTVTQGQLDVLAPALSRRLNVDVRLRLIGNCFDEAEQVQLLDTMAKEVIEGASLDLDVTHGFRHLPMLALLAAMYIKAIRGAQVAGVWYAAFNPEAADARVMRLDGLMRTYDWISALTAYEASGNYAGIATLLKQEGLPVDKADALIRGHHLEQTLNIPDASNNVLGVLKTLDAPLHGTGELFRRRLAERLGWARERELPRQQHRLARQALERGDFLRAAIFGLESFITRRCLRAGLDAKDYRVRRDVTKKLQQEIKEGSYGKTESEAYYELNELRNAMAHGTPPVSSLVKVLKDPGALRERLREDIETLNRNA